MIIRKIKIFIIIFVILGVAGALGFYLISSRDAKISYETETIKRGNIIQTVSETGTIKSVKEINLSFLNSGRIKKINVNIGDMVIKDMVLAELDYDNLEIKKQEALANISANKESLNKLLSGATQEEIAISKANVNQAKRAYENAKIEFEKTKNIVEENILQAKKTLNDLESNSENNITAYEQSIITAQTNLKNTKETYQRIIDNYEETAISVSDDKIAVAKTALDTIDRILNDDDAKDLISVKDKTYLNNAKQEYQDGKNAINDNNNYSTISNLVEKTQITLNIVFDALQSTFSALEKSVVSSDFTQAELDAFKADISAKQTIIAAAISSMQTVKQNLDDAILSYNTNVSTKKNALAQSQASYNDAINTAKNNLKTAEFSGEQQITLSQSKVDTTLEAWNVAETKLKQIIAPANKHDVLLAKAKLKQAELAFDTIKDQIKNSLIKAPISGQITKINYEEGEQFQMGQPVISMLGKNNFEIEVLISEADIAKLKINDLAKITLDAFGEDLKFNGKVFFIEPAETIIQDVIYYKVNIKFIEDNIFKKNSKNIKSGMTANIYITTANKNNVLIIPSRAIIDKNENEKFTRFLINGQIIENKIKTGLHGDEGFVEIISGAKEGDEVITYIKTEK